jgi:hypothetical protein
MQIVSRRTHHLSSSSPRAVTSHLNAPDDATEPSAAAVIAAYGKKKLQKNSTDDETVTLPGWGRIVDAGSGGPWVVETCQCMRLHWQF